jgi:hypothetical protein
VHLLTRSSTEVYFEVRRYPNLTAEAEYAAHTAQLAQRFVEAGFAATALAPTTLAGWPAQVYAFRWQLHERAVVLLPLDGVLYRIIYDPRSTLNVEILETVG